MAIVVSACGGGGGGSGSSSGGEGSGSNAIGLEANGVDRASYLALSGQVNEDGQATRITPEAPDTMLSFLLRSAHAVVPATNNILAYDRNGEPIENPLSTDVSVLISEVAEGPAGEYIYLAIQDRHNRSYFTDYAALTGPRCTLYRISKASEDVSCLMTHEQYDPYISTANAKLADNSSESFIKFDEAGNGYFIAFDQQSPYGLGGTEKQRLVKVSTDGAVTTVRDPGGYNARALVYARNGKLFFTEDEFYSDVPEGEEQEIRAWLFDPAAGEFESVDAPSAINRVASSVGRSVFWSTGPELFRLDQENAAFERILTSSDHITALHRSPSGEVFAQQGDGRIWSVAKATPTVIADVGRVPYEPGHPRESPSADEASNFTYPFIASSERWLLSRGSTDAGDPTVCVVDLRDYGQTCDDSQLDAYDPMVHTLAVIADRGYAYFTHNGVFQQARLALPGYIDTPSSNATITESRVGDGSAVATVALRPPISASGALDTVEVTSTTATREADGEQWTELYFDFSAPVQNLRFDELALVEDDSARAAHFSLADGGTRLVATFPEAGAASPRLLEPANPQTFTLELPPSVRLPGQTFVSDFGSRSVDVTVQP
ncbi:hypothetical protein [Halofilum ochraceum]|uniref:hypothetical protein n=1 Tax=Halofilum ochraceum TaxID=1611323 RepID=UPI001113225A|nr:hypothetical protein [Halofilum ochraceum]